MDTIRNLVYSVPDNKKMLVLLILIFLDIFLGVLRSLLITKDFTSKRLKSSIHTHIIVALSIPIVYFVNINFLRMDLLDSLDVLLFIWYAFSYIFSLLANIAIFGVPFPKKVIEILKNEIENKNCKVVITKKGYIIKQKNGDVIVSKNIDIEI